MAESYPEIIAEQLISIVNEKMKMSQSLMDQLRTSKSWTDQKKFEYQYGQYMAYKEVLLMLQNT